MESETFTTSWTEEQTAEASEKVLRRAKVSRMARQLQSRLALASYKTQRGWENLDLDSIEPRVDQDLMKKRMQAIQEGKMVSPQHAYSEADGMRGIRRRPSNGSEHSSHRKKRARTAAPGLESDQHMLHGQEDLYDLSARHSFRNANRNRTWKENHRLPQSSPVYHHSFDMTSQPFSFAPSPTREQSPTLLPNHFEPQPVFHSSPPRTPPHRTIPPRPVFTTDGEKLDGNGKADGEGADLLLYLATSPSPNTLTKTKVSVAPSTPPSKAAALPSSMMNTPGGGGGGSFNFHDFVHITPSPAQGMWGNGGRTPMTMNTRRRLNFDGLVPPSPMNGGSQGSQGSQGKSVGLGMELGGELVSPTSGV
ncbi:hypothetical protein ABW19_dt0200867 [Dactylella cylindrospora]|nr:hypothetical protein ABW19_dt0200867 [Dactylella cylindrospora]